MDTAKNSVLIVDDEAVNIRAFIEMLSGDYTVFVEKSGLKCLNTAKRLSPDIILLDVMMPDIDGFDVIKSLKADNETKDIPVIFVTGLASPVDETKGFSLGAVDYIKKPFSEHVVKMRVHHQIKIINQHRKIQSLRDAEEIERKKREQEKINRRIKRILNSAPISVEIYNEHKELIDVNHGTLTMFNIDDKENFLKLYSTQPNLFSPEYQACGKLSTTLKKHYFQTVTESEPLYFNWLHRSSDGVCFPTTVSLVLLEIDKIYYYVAYVHDLREIKRLEKERMEALEGASRAKSRFLARMSHEIRTPISAVLGISEILLRGQKIPEELEGPFTRIYDSAKTLLGLVNEILDFSKIESGEMKLICNPYEVASLVNDTVGLQLFYLDNKNVTFTMNVDENLPITLVGDVLRVRQIVSNLLSNAFKYTNHGFVNISLKCEYISEDQVYLVVVIEDTGVGMTRHEVEMIKDEYVRVNEESNSYVSGTGLGIPIVYSLTQMMNADIDFQSEVGVGTKVTVKIPQETQDSKCLGANLARSLENFTAAPQGDNEELEFKPVQMPQGKVLVVDDVETNLYVAEAMLKSFSLSVDLVKSAREAIHKVTNGETYDIIFMDQMMPEMDGIEATKKLREIGYPHPIVALTANAVKRESDAFMDSGLSGFMTKPIDIKVLSTYLHKFVKS